MTQAVRVLLRAVGQIGMLAAVVNVAVPTIIGLIYEITARSGRAWPGHLTGGHELGVTTPPAYPSRDTTCSAPSGWRPPTPGEYPVFARAAAIAETKGPPVMVSSRRLR